MGYKAWGYLERLASADVNEFLASQLVFRFATTADRDADLPAEEGMLSYVPSEGLQIYSPDSEWVDVVPVAAATGYLGTFTTVGRPAAAVGNTGQHYYDTTVSKPVWSDGTAWRDAAGTTV